MLKKPLVNNQIRAREVRVVDEEGKNLGVFTLEKALQIAKERELDLVQITEKVIPPVCKITDFGKYLYNSKKKKRGSGTKKGSEIKGIRLSFKISPHDLETKAKIGEKFLKKGYRIRIEMKLTGREKIFFEPAKEKINQFLKIIEATIPLKVERELKKEPRGLTMIIAKQ